MEGLIQKPLSQFRRTASRKALEAIEVTQLGQVIVTCFLSCSVSGEITRCDPDLICQEPQYLNGNGFAWCKQPTWISQGTELKCKAHFVVGATPLFDLFKIKVIKRVVLMQAGSIRWQTQKAGLLPPCQNRSTRQNMSPLIKW